MPETNDIDIVLWIYIGIFTVPIIIAVLVALCLFLDKFSEELKHLNKRIRKTKGAERKYWKRKRRKLWLSILPFVKY